MPRNGEISGMNTKECIRQNQKNEIMQLFDSLDERRRRLVLVHIRAISGKDARRGL